MVSSGARSQLQTLIEDIPDYPNVYSSASKDKASAYLASFGGAIALPAGTQRHRLEVRKRRLGTTERAALRRDHHPDGTSSANARQRAADQDH